MEPLLVLTGLVAGAVGGAFCAFVILRNSASARVRQAQESAGRALSDAETTAKEIVLSAKEEAHRIRTTAEDETRERQNEVLGLEQRIQQREEIFVQRLDELEQRQESIRRLEAEHERRSALLAEREERVQQELARASGMSLEQARAQLFGTLEKNLTQEIGNRIRDAELTARQESEARAREVVVTAIQRIAADQTTESTVSAVHLPNDEMKGRIIGREGRNIRALELATGVDLIIDDTPETVMISGFDPVRREIARNALNRLLTDGRIHPSRIEEVVAKARSEVQAQIKAEGEAAVYEVGVQGAHPELIRLLGCLRFRTSYGQNVLSHSREVAMLCGAMAAELGCGAEEEAFAKEAGLLHDLGKAVDHEVEGPHAIIGGEVLSRLGRPREVVHAVKAHHYDEEPTSLVAMLVIAADAISASRPGARRETLSNYIKRLEKLESIANSFDGVERSFAVQAGREIRIIVRPEQIDDPTAQLMARDIVKRIEGELTYPGQIKVTVIRETRVVDYAK
ncbi:MAG TPA: ribonuclease Y [Candidatus Dormibacteraeota bacterium]|jgi:ribonuclease Y|nr:ribonuclease Y [Candidatus Dormibacteraeota bacterium]